ncbi:MAG: AraC family transcriptional regulator [Rubrivivax sp.]
MVAVYDPTRAACRTLIDAGGPACCRVAAELDATALRAAGGQWRSLRLARADPALVVALQLTPAGDAVDPALPAARLTIALSATRWRGGPPSGPLAEAGPMALDARVPRFGVFVVPAGTALHWHRRAPTRLLSIYLDPSDPGTPDPLPAALTCLQLSMRVPHAGPLVEQLVEEIERTPTPGGTDAADALARLLLVRLAREHARAAAADGHLSAEQWSRVQALVRARLAHRLPVAAMAAAAGLPGARFARAILRDTGCTPHQYLIEQRLRRALELLRASAEPLADIALASGFASQQHLARWMRRRVGATPAQWRTGGGPVDACRAVFSSRPPPEAPPPAAAAACSGP